MEDLFGVADVLLKWMLVILKRILVILEWMLERV
jgi:hypothetical protein